MLTEEMMVAATFAAWAYILVDVSGSMGQRSAGKEPRTPLDGVADALAGIRNTLITDEYLGHFGWLSVIKFAAQTEVMLPMTQMAMLRPPPGSPDPIPPVEGTEQFTDLGGAFRFLSERMRHDARLFAARGVAFKAPAVFCLTDAEARGPAGRIPLAMFRRDIEQFHEMTVETNRGPRHPWSVGFGLGHVDEEILVALSSPGMPAVVCDGPATAEVAATLMAAILESVLNSVSGDPQITIPTGCRNLKDGWEQ